MSARRNCPIIRAKREQRAQHMDRFKRRRRPRPPKGAEQPAIWAPVTAKSNH